MLQRNQAEAVGSNAGTNDLGEGGLGAGGGHVGGVVTPAFALGTPLVSALLESGLTFREHELPIGSAEAAGELMRQLAGQVPSSQLPLHRPQP